MLKPKAAFFDGDGVVLKMPKVHFHEAYARRHGIDPGHFDQFFGPGYNEILRGSGDLASRLEFFKQIYGQHDPNKLVAEWINIEGLVNKSLLQVIRQKRSGGLAAYMATVQEKLRFSSIKQTLAGEFDGFFATCELGFLKVEDEDKDPSGLILPNPPARYFSRLLGGLALAPEEVAYIDDRIDNVEIAKRKGINAHIYESPQQVERILNGGW